jgi:polar amino acid transport system substrate-binding protein
MKPRGWTLLWTTVFFVLVLGIASLSSAAEYQSKLDEVIARGRVIVGTTNTVPPFGFIDKDSKQLVGIDIDIGKLMARAFFKDEKQVEFVVVPNEARWASVQSGKIDCGLSGTTIYPERALNVAFTRRYLDSGAGMIVRNDSPIKHLADLNNEKYTLAITTNPQMAERAQRYVPKAKVLTFPTNSDEFMAVQTGRADAAQLDIPSLRWLAAQSPGKFRILPEFVSELSSDAIWLRKGDFQWWLALDTFVGEMLEGTLYPQYKALYQKWLGEDPPPQRFYLPK